MINDRRPLLSQTTYQNSRGEIVERIKEVVGGVIYISESTTRTAPRLDRGGIEIISRHTTSSRVDAT